MPLELSIGQCELGAVEITISNSVELLRGIRGALDSLLLTPGRSITQWYAVAPGFKPMALWRRDSMTVIAGVASNKNPIERTVRSDQRFVFAASNRLAFDDDGLLPFEEARLPTDSFLRRYVDAPMSMTRFTPALQRDMRQLITTAIQLADTNWKTIHDTIARSSGTVDRWFAAIHTATPAQRSAGLLVADRMAEVTVPGWMDANNESEFKPKADTGFRAILEKHGARFAYDHLDDMLYLRTWIREALRVAPASAAGQLALLDLIDVGFHTDPACGPDGFGHRTVIREVNSYLARFPQTPIRGQLEFALGSAYTDAVALASGAAYDGEVDSASVAALPSNRRNALQHFRAGFAIDSTSPRARAAWFDAWRLLARLPPSGTHFYRYYD